MIIDPTYIQQVLNVQVSEQVMNYLIKHIFNYICSTVGLESSLEKEEILTIPQTPIENPNILENDITLLQETLIYGIACDLIKTNEQVIDIPSYLFDFYQSEIETVTYCHLYDYCLNNLDELLNSMSQIDYVRKYLFLDNRITDNDIAFLIQHYTNDLINHLPQDAEIDTDSWLFKQALLMQIACHLFKVRPNIIGTPKSYKVDEVRVTWTVGFNKEGATWCDLAEEAFADLKKKYYGLYGFVAWDRPGARTKYGYHGPRGRQ